MPRTLTATSTKLSFRRYLMWYPVELSTHDLDPYTRVTGISFCRSGIRWIMGFLAHPKDVFKVLKAVSPLKKTETQTLFHQ